MRTLIASTILAVSLSACSFGAESEEISNIESAISEKPERVTINDIAESIPEFSTLAGLLDATGLDAALDGKKQYTVFAPTNSAFEALFAVVDPSSLTTEQVTDVLLYHVAHGKRFSGDVLDSDRIRMLNGDFTWVDAENLTINDAGLVTSLIDVEASNGVIHVIDTVLLP